MKHHVVAHCIHSSLHTTCSYSVFGEGADVAITALRQTIEQGELMLSRYKTGSEVSSINANSGSPVVVSPPVYTLLSQIFKYAKWCDGLFDPTISPLMDVWDWQHASKAPLQANIEEAVSLVNYRDLVFDAQNGAVKLSRQGQALDLGGAGKGYLADQCTQLLAWMGYSSALVNLGGNVAVLGSREDRTSWSVGVRHPRIASALVGTLSVSDVSVVTSGDYERFFLDDQNRRWHHILDPRTGYPADSGLLSATVVHPSSLCADILSTALFVAGMEAALHLLTLFPAAEALFIDTNLEIFLTKGLRRYFHPASGSVVKIL